MPAQIPYKAYPIMRVAHKILKTHWPHQSDSDHVKIFSDLFETQLHASALQGPPKVSTFTMRWGDRYKVNAWKSALKDARDMTDKEFLAYVWLYDSVKGSAKKLGMKGATETFYSDDEDNIDIELDSEEEKRIEKAVDKFVSKSGGVELRGDLLGVNIPLPMIWAGRTLRLEDFFAGRPIPSIGVTKRKRATWLRTVRETSKRKLRRVARAQIALRRDSHAPSASEEEQDGIENYGEDEP
ncbi:hypothetical protein Slin15195_G060890 [Septoria linicola]|uniref:Uncharacterized protein n=1 Tax=Septoria linicola TaxID=215465 RepID=A0A9Q9EJ88_9PEZI|nr:hypothetical protein Slin15195_G060890 [Septoria linicola]